jgi:hypothetical protein
VFVGSSRTDPEHPELGTFPDWVKLQDEGPTIDQLYNMLAGGAGVVMGMNDLNGHGHIVTLTGMDWDDADGDGIVDQDEGAKLYVIDPLDPSNGFYSTFGWLPQNARFTELSVWQDEVLNPETNEPVSVLKIEYTQYEGSHDPNQPYDPYTPYERNARGPTDLLISAVFSMTAVP